MKSQFLAIVVFITLSIVACGNSTEKKTTENDLVKEVVETIETTTAASPIEEEVEISEEKEALTVEEEVVTETKTETKVKEEVKVEEPIEEKQVVEEVIRPKHDLWDVLTKKYVSAVGKVNYKGMKADLSKISYYLEHLKNTPPKNDWSKNEKLAYWINLYNASTVYLIASNYPTSSITKLNGGKPWDKKFVKSGTKVYSLNDIENNIVRPRFKDPRIHAALNCAAVSCPKLLNGAYFPSKLNAQLDKQTRAWINDSSKNKLNGNKAQLSQIFDWYKIDFKDGVVAFINKYISTGVALEPKAKITYLEYDWALNE